MSIKLDIQHLDCLHVFTTECRIYREISTRGLCYSSIVFQPEGASSAKGFVLLCNPRCAVPLSPLFGTTSITYPSHKNVGWHHSICPIQPKIRFTGIGSRRGRNGMSYQAVLQLVSTLIGRIKKCYGILILKIIISYTIGDYRLVAVFCLLLTSAMTLLILFWSQKRLYSNGSHRA